MTALASELEELERGAAQPKKKEKTKGKMPQRLQLRVRGMRTMRVRSRNVLDVDGKPMARVPIPSHRPKGDPTHPTNHWQCTRTDNSAAVRVRRHSSNVQRPSLTAARCI